LHHETSFVSSEERKSQDATQAKSVRGRGKATTTTKKKKKKAQKINQFKISKFPVNPGLGLIEL